MFVYCFVRSHRTLFHCLLVCECGIAYVDEAAREQAPILKRQKKTYEIWRQFSNKQEFDKFWEQEKKEWRCKATKSNVETWQCRFEKNRKRGYNCGVVVRVIFSDFNDSVTVEQSIDQHNHEPIYNVFAEHVTTSDSEEEFCVVSPNPCVHLLERQFLQFDQKFHFELTVAQKREHT